MLRGIPPCGHPFKSPDGYECPPCGFPCIPGIIAFCGGPPILPGIIFPGGLQPGVMKAGSPCWFIPANSATVVECETSGGYDKGY